MAHTGLTRNDRRAVHATPRRKSRCSILKVIFACVHNAGRSQISAAFFNKYVDPAKAKAISAGTHPIDRVHPEVIAAMHEVGMDLSAAQPQKLTPALAQDADLLITMGDRKSTRLNSSHSQI